MIAYILEGVGPQGATADKRMGRLRSVGPWQYQMDRRGARATWRGPMLSRDAFGEERTTADGLIYLPPRVLPKPEVLLRPDMAERADACDVVVSQDEGITLRIVPAYLTPRQILEDNSYGKPVTAYGRAVRALFDRLENNPEERFSEYLPDLTECVRLAIMYAYRVTRELLMDLDWVNEGSVVPLWQAAVNFPKAKPPAESVP